MDSLIPAFFRVQRGLADAQEAITIANDLLSGRKDASTLSSSETLGILDFPDPEQQTENIATATTLSKSDLLERGFYHTQDLTVLEMNILKQRYWLDVTDAEWAEQSRAEEALKTVSVDNWMDAKEELQQIRSALYDTNEDQAFRNIVYEERRRERKARGRREVEAKLPRAQPWVKKFWEGGHADMLWGFAAFFHPNIGSDNEEIDEFGSRRDMALWRARDAVGCVGPIGANWRVQYLDWPIDPHDQTEGVEGGAGSAAATRGELAADGQTVEDTDNFQTEIAKLRERFRALRADESNKKRKTDSEAATSGLKDGILRNVFLLFTRPCVDAVLAGYVDHMWVWAIDPDYDAPADEDAASGYKGYLRVRLQQLVNNFFDARKFHEDEYTMQQLWRAAQKSQNEAFVSMKEDEMGLVTMSRDTGSALRPPGSQKIVYGPPRT